MTFLTSDLERGQKVKVQGHNEIFRLYDILKKMVFDSELIVNSDATHKKNILMQSTINILMQYHEIIKYLRRYLDNH